MAKQVVIKAHEMNRDPFLALLEWGNTPSEQLGPLLAQLILSCQARNGLLTRRHIAGDAGVTPHC